MYLFYAPDIKQTLTLPEEESLHCVQVLRAKAGEHILITDGCGTIYEAEVRNPHRKHCEVTILREQQPQPLHEGYVHIAIAPTKNIDRLEWMIEKCTEMGVDEITPILCRFSERKTINEERLQKIMVSAAKQSLKASFPQLNPLTDFHALVANAKEQDLLIAHCMPSEQAENSADSSNKQSHSADSSDIQSHYAASADKHALSNCITRGHSVLILIGPEGDFSDKEIADALNHHFRPISLGRARLRTETAGLVACHTALLLNE